MGFKAQLKKKCWPFWGVFAIIEVFIKRDNSKKKSKSSELSTTNIQGVLMIKVLYLPSGKLYLIC